VTSPVPSSDPGSVDRTAQFIGVGCLMTFLGAISCAMVGVLVSVMVGFLTRAPRCEGIPSCNWHLYAFGGAVVGAISLPMLVLNRLRQSARDAAERNRGG
jgi:hypothetical protein